MGVVEIAPRTWRFESLIGPRNLFRYLPAPGHSLAPAQAARKGASHFASLMVS
jgi:hypothetical protein